MKTVVIPSAGTGSRLGELTKNYNKAMCTLGPKPVISYIIEHFTKKDEIIILLGYKGDYLKQVVEACYPDWNIKFVNVDIYEGEGSGLGYSLSKAIKKLQKPFIFWPNDTLVDNDFSEMPTDTNWVLVGSQEQDSENYRHALINESSVTILPKNATGYQNARPYTGVCYIKDYEDFWRMFYTNRELFITEGEVVGINNLKHTTVWNAINWVDAGNREIFERVKKDYSSKMDETILEKPDEAIWFLDDRVIKFHIDEKFIKDRVDRFDTFLCDKQKENGIKIPELISFSKNVYVYMKEPGIIASKCLTPIEFRSLLLKFFVMPTEELVDEEKERIYEDFYKNKTISRIRKFCVENNEKDDVCIINGIQCRPALEVVDTVSWKDLAKGGVFTKNYHGDFHLENILKQGNDFVMLDWRQNFGDSDIGDVYYDLAKMWHSLIVNHNMVRDDLFSLKTVGENKYVLDIHRTLLDTEMENELLNFSYVNGFNLVQLRLITAIVFLNIAACHIQPYSRFLFLLGKYLINKAVFS